MNPPPSPSPSRMPPASASVQFYHQLDLPTALSSLTSLLHLSETSLHRLPIPTTTTSTLLPCPFNPNHHLPPNSLFYHHLNCPFPIHLPSPNYPHTLHSTTLPSPLPSTTSDLHFSLENYIGHNFPGNNFFYQNCPAPVTPTTRPPPVLTLPRVLYVECDSFYKEIEPSGLPVNFVRLLPSEIWAIQSEIEAWNGSDVGFSIRILRAILRMRDCKLSRLSEWIVSRSPKYGAIIDFAMRDHIVLLVRLCLKAIVREAFGLVGFLFGGEGVKMEETEQLSNLSSRSFDCPVFREVLSWLASQFGLLYGEVNGKFFAVDVLKECILDPALSASLFAVEEMNSDLEKVERTKLIDDCKVKESENFDSQTVGGSVIYISQVAAAVTALHERSLIEEKIRASRDTRRLTAYQRNMEHSYVSQIAEEERRKRPDYRPIIEHDSLLWHRSQNQDTNKIKTREELLAEERDYKRRRMSYRGKKSKRSTVEVMRDIIEKYMEEIKQSGIMGSSTSEMVNEAEVENEHPHDYKNKQSSSHNHHDLQDLNRNVISIVKHERDDYLERPDLRQSGSHSREPHHRERRERSESKSREENCRKTERHEREYNSRKRERDEDDREYRERGRRKTKRDDRERNEEDGRRKDRERRKTNRSNRSRSERYNEFEDRYDPADSREES